MAMTEYEKAKQWRENLGLSVVQLAEKTGYSVESIYEFERGLKSGSRAEIKPWIWHRYRLLCAGLTAEIKNNKPFAWKA